MLEVVLGLLMGLVLELLTGPVPTGTTLDTLVEGFFGVCVAKVVAPEGLAGLLPLGTKPGAG